MKLTFVFLVVCGIIFHLKFGEPKESLIPQAIQQVIEQHYVKNSVRFEIVYNSNDLQVLQETLKLIKELKDYRIRKVNDDDRTQFHVQRSMIFIFDSFEQFKNLESRFHLVDGVPKEMNILIYCAKWEEEIIPPAHEFQIYSYLVENDDEIILKSLILFTPQHCRPLQVVDVNNFSRKTLKWKDNSTFFMTTVRDFHGCEVYFGVEINTPSSSSLAKAEVRADGTYNIQGIAVDLFDSLSSHLNYKVVKVVVDGKARPKIDQWYSSLAHISEENSIYQDMTTPVDTLSMVIAVSPGEPYSPIEKFFMPFDLETWIWFTIVFVAAFSVTVFIKLSRLRSLRNFVIGEDISTPGLNIFAIFMGIGMLRVPSRVVSRFLLMNFILFSLIMRTAYQGKYFEFMTKDVHKKEIQTVEELIEKNYTLYVDSEQHWRYTNEPYLRDVKRLSFTEYGSGEQNKVFHDMQDASFKGCLLDLNTNFKYYENDTIGFHLLEKKVVTFNYAFVFERNSFLSSIFRMKIEQLVTGGFYDEWHRLFMHRNRRFDKKQQKPYDTVLTLQHLSIGFYIWLLMCLLSTCAFIGELLTYWGPKVSSMLFFHYILSRFYKMQILMH